MSKEWQPNENQIKFLKELDGEELTLAEISGLAGVEFKTGSVNPLVKKGLAEHGDDRTIVCPCCGRKRVVKTYIATFATWDLLRKLGLKD